MKNQLISPSTNFNAVRDGRNAPDFYFDLDLSSPFDSIINVAGNSFYADANPADGVCTVYFQDTDRVGGTTPFYVSPGFIARIPFTQIRVVNSFAQPGKKCRVVYGTDTDFQPGSVAQVSVSANVGTISETTVNGLKGRQYFARSNIAVPGASGAFFALYCGGTTQAARLTAIRLHMPSYAGGNIDIPVSWYGDPGGSQASSSSPCGGPIPAARMKYSFTTAAANYYDEIHRRAVSSSLQNSSITFEDICPIIITPGNAVGIFVSPSVTVNTSAYFQYEMIDL